MLEGEVAEDWPQEWLTDISMALDSLTSLPLRHPPAPEAPAWGQDLRNVLMRNGFRVLFRVVDAEVQVVRVRHQRQQQLQR